MNRLWTVACVTVVVLAGGSGLAKGDTAFDNLGSAPYNSEGYSSFGLLDGVFYGRGMQFTATESVYLSALEVAIGQAYYDGTTQPGAAQVELMTDTANTPGTVLETWTTSSQSSISGGLVALTPSSTLAITAGTKYWIMLDAAPGSSLGGAWFFADDQHTGSTLTAAVTIATGSISYTPLTRGFRSQVDGTAWLVGDANLDGKVDVNDLHIVLSHLGSTTSLRANGNFDGAATIDLTDLNDVLNNLGTGVSAPSAAAITTTPEPMSLAVLGLAFPLLVRKRAR
jgi:hypothetical protein